MTSKGIVVTRRSNHQLTRDRVLLLLTLGGDSARRLEDSRTLQRQFRVVSARPRPRPRAETLPAIHTAA